MLPWQPNKILLHRKLEDFLRFEHLYLFTLIFKEFIGILNNSIHDKIKRKYEKGLGCERVKRRSYLRKERNAD